MLRGLWSRFVGRRNQDAREHEVERERMTDADRRTDDESFEARQADVATQDRLGGGDPERLIPDDDPEHR